MGELCAALRGGIEAPLLHAEETHSLEAYESFSKGLMNLRSRGPGGDRPRHPLSGSRGQPRSALRAGPHAAGRGPGPEGRLPRHPRARRAGPGQPRARALPRAGLGDAWRLKGGALITLGRDDEALQAFERALFANPTDASAYSGLGRVHFTLRGDFARAIPCYETALALNPQAGWAALQLAHCAALVHDFPRAEAAARRAVVLQQELLSGRAGIVIVGAWVRLGQAYALQGRYAEAIHEYESELEFLKGVDHALRGTQFHRAAPAPGRGTPSAWGTPRAAAPTWTWRSRPSSAACAGADDPATRYYAACAYALRGEPEAALACLEKAAERRCA